MKQFLQTIFVALLIGINTNLYSQQSIGRVVSNSNKALPSSYDWQEYSFGEPDDQGNCTGKNNSTAKIEEVFFAQTHRNATDHPFFFIIGYRPMLMQVAVTGQGNSPDVEVEGFVDSRKVGTLCLKGPSTLSSSIDLDIPNFENYFSVTIPKSWVQPGLELRVKAGNDSRELKEDELKIGPYTELNLVMYNMDVMDYNTSPHQTPIIDDFLQEVASAFPASVIRFGVFPETIVFPEIVANADKEELVRLKTKARKEDLGVKNDGYINSITNLFLESIQQSTFDYSTTIYFGNTLNLAPGGWGGNKSFVSFDYDDVFIHELGHALSLPHWADSYGTEDPSFYEYLYPYGGENGNGGGQGETWNFIQHLYEFVDPICQYDARGKSGIESSDAMQRNNHCLEKRSNGPGPWDGFGDFSALAIHRDMIGAREAYTGTVDYRGETKEFQFPMREGSPIVSLEGNKRVFKRDELQNPDLAFYERAQLPGEEKIEQDVYLIYGTIHPSQDQANIVYEPIKYKGVLPPVIDPTDPNMFAELKKEKYRDYFGQERDITLKLTYEDGSIMHTLNPFHSYQRAPYTWGYHVWRNDLRNFALVVPADKDLAKVELYSRPFTSLDPGNTAIGNINNTSQNITAENFMEDAKWRAEFEYGKPLALGSNTIGNRVWHDLNRNGKDDPNEPGIEGVKMLLWADSDDDGIPDSNGWGGFAVTDENGEYSYGGLSPGNYLVFVWFLENYDEGAPLQNMIPTSIYTDPNTDINLDNNGRPGDKEFPGLGKEDIASGIITLSADGEPLGDGDRVDSWFDYDPSGNMTIDFGFHSNTGCASINADFTGVTNLCESDKGNLTITPTNGDGPYTYRWNTGATSASISNLDAGDYRVSISDRNGCEGLETIEIKEAITVGARLSGTELICNGSRGSITVEPSSGDAPYSYNWNNGDRDAEIDNLRADRYRVTVTDNNGCTGRYNFEIEEREEIQLSITGTDSLCAGELGSLTANANNGRSPYSYLWNNGDQSQNIEGLEVGMYTVDVTDNNGCTNSLEYEIKTRSGEACSSTPTNDLFENNIRISPNPFTNTINIANPDSEHYVFELRTLTGQRFIKQQIHNSVNQINIEQIASGIYLAIIRDQKGVPIKYQKMIKI